MCSVLALAVTFGTAIADPVSHSESHVYVVVDPTIAVNAVSANVNIGNVQIGEFSALITWEIHCNTEAVKFCVGATDLYKGDDPNSMVAPLPLVMPNGVLFNAASGNPVNAGEPVAPFIPVPTTVGGWPGFMTDYLIIESSQMGYFSQLVDTSVWWLQPDFEQPQGQYSGKVVLWGYVVPNLQAEL
jgi:hypothetical protein